MKSKHCAFTLLEVVVALAMLTLIAIPAIGLATMAVGSSKATLTAGTASELKTRVDVALRVLIGNGSFDEDATMVATRDLQYIEEESSTEISEKDQFFRVKLTTPEGYSFTEGDRFRIVVYEVVWPYKSEERGERTQIFFSTVFRNL